MPSEDEDVEEGDEDVGGGPPEKVLAPSCDASQSWCLPASGVSGQDPERLSRDVSFKPGKMR